MSREVCGICWCPYDEDTGECACEPEPEAKHMTNLRTAAQQALEALEAIREADTAGATPKMVIEARSMYEPTITALRAALAEPIGCVCGEPSTPDVVHRTEGPCYVAEPVQEPVAWMSKADIEHPSGWRTVFLHTSAMPTENSVPLYAAPPQRKPLKEEEIVKCWNSIQLDAVNLKHDFARAIERAHGIT